MSGTQSKASTWKVEAGDSEVPGHPAEPGQGQPLLCETGWGRAGQGDGGLCTALLRLLAGKRSVHALSAIVSHSLSKQPI